MSAKTPEGFDLTYYEREIAPRLPAEVLDFHTHIWQPDHWLGYDPQSGASVSDNSLFVPEEHRAHQKYMTTTISYPAEELLRDGKLAFPDRPYNAVVFGQPTPKCDIDKTNVYAAASAAKSRNLFPLRVTGAVLPTPIEAVRQEILEGGFYGYKVFLNWVGDEYPPLVVEDMLSDEQLRLANELGLIVLLHVPRGGRLADPEVGASVRRTALRYPRMRLVLAHCGRCYRYEEIREALHWVADLDNVWFDCSMAMEPAVLAYILQRKDPEKMLFATDYPVAAMRGKRVNVADHWVDLVLPGFPEAHYRVISDNMHASFMVYEIAKAVLIGAELAGLSEAETKRIFWQNGMDLLDSVKSVL